MTANQTLLHKAAPRLIWLLRGESLVASVGIALAVILLGALAACSWWTMNVQQQSVLHARETEIQATGALLVQSAEALLARGDLAAVRRLMITSGKSFDLSHCRLVLPDGGVLADADPNHITVMELPAAWPRGNALDRPPVFPPGQPAMSYPLAGSHGGTARLEIAGPVSELAGGVWEAQGGVALIGAAGLAAMLLVYRRMRSRLAALGVIREALRALDHGEKACNALTVSGDLGPEAKAWNELLAENHRLRQALTADKAQNSLGSSRQAQADLDTACDAMPHGVILLDERMNVRYTNGAAAIFLQHRRDDFAGAPVAKFIKDAKLLAAIADACTGASRKRTTVVAERSDDAGGGVLRFNLRPMGKEESAGALVVIEDITQQRVAETSRNNFVAQATHELRTPLTNIRLYLETALNEGENDAVLRAKCLNVMNQESRRLEQIVSEILSISEIEAGSLKLNRDDVRLDQLFKDLEGPYQAMAAEKKMRLAFNLPPKLPVIQGDRDKVMIALQNLVGNAVKYTPEGGQVAVTVKVDARQVVVEVTDTGFGIAETEQERIFEKFYRAKDVRVAKITGSGLGLALTREVIRLHGGDVQVQSQLNKGSTFTLTLPYAGEAA